MIDLNKLTDEQKNHIIILAIRYFEAATEKETIEILSQLKQSSLQAKVIASTKIINLKSFICSDLEFIFYDFHCGKGEDKQEDLDYTVGKLIGISGGDFRYIADSGNEYRYCKLRLKHWYCVHNFNTKLTMEKLIESIRDSGFEVTYDQGVGFCITEEKEGYVYSHSDDHQEPIQ